MQSISFALSIYSFLIFIRIIMTWFQTGDYGRITYWLGRITDPYLNWFRRFEFLTLGGLDLSIVAALVTIWIARSIVLNIAYTGTITLGIILAIALSAVASALFFFLTLFLILAIVRLLGSLLGANTASRFWIVLDQILEPIVHGTIAQLMRGRPTTYQNALLLFIAVDLAVILAGRLLIAIVVGLLRGLPF